MSLWLQSLSWCLEEAKSPEEKARRIFEHLSMTVPRHWWDSSLKTGKIPDTQRSLISGLLKELLKIPCLHGRVDLGLLIALAFADGYEQDNSPRFGSIERDYSIEQYLARANLVLSERPELKKLGESIL